jgi:TusA-related sulfurtransferase
MDHALANLVIDARAMEPPEPFVATMDALDAMDPSHKLLLDHQP